MKNFIKHTMTYIITLFILLFVTFIILLAFDILYDLTIDFFDSDSPFWRVVLLMSFFLYTALFLRKQNDSDNKR